MIEAVDLFCGSGGLTCGLRRSGVNVLAGVDFEKECQYPYERNNGSKFLNWDIGKTEAGDIAAMYSKDVVRVLAGCAPCQPFSKYNNGVDTSLSEKWWLLYSFQRIIEGVMPEIVVMENVTDVVRHKVYHDFVSHLKNLGYHVSENNVSCVDYGIPQKRKRQIVLCSRFGPIELLSKTHETPVTVREDIGHLSRIESGEVYPSDPLHRAAKLSDVNLKRIKASVAGGTWRDWPEEQRIGAHKKASGATYASVYGRMEWDKPAPTMTTQCYGFGNGRFGHPEQDRAISLREAAIFQTYPEEYVFFYENNPLSFAPVGRMIGNTVPVRLGEVIGQSIQQHVKAMV